MPLQARYRLQIFEKLAYGNNPTKGGFSSGAGRVKFAYVQIGTP